MSRMRQIRAEISEHDSVHRYTVDVGVDVFSGRARCDCPAFLSCHLRMRNCEYDQGSQTAMRLSLAGARSYASGSASWGLALLPRCRLVKAVLPVHQLSSP